MRIALIHALRHSAAPIEEAFARLWPDARIVNLLDDSLSQDLAGNGALTPAMHERFLVLARYVVMCKSDAILFTCSAFGPCITRVATALAPRPVLKPNEAMVEIASGTGKRIGLIASFAPTLQTLPREFPPSVPITAVYAEGAMEALNRGDAVLHDRIVAEAATGLADCDVIALAQFSLARAAPAVRAATGKTVLTTPDSAVHKLRELMTESRA